MNMNDIGIILYNKREASSLKLHVIAEHIKVRAKYLMAIEDGNLKELPSLVYTAGYIKLYADYLGLNGDKLAEDYRRIMSKLDAPEEHVVSRSVKESFKPSFIILSVSLFLALLLFYSWSKIDIDLANYKVSENIKKDSRDNSFANYHAINADIIKKAPHGENDKNNNHLKSNLNALLKNFRNNNLKLVILAKESTKIKILNNKGEILYEKNLQIGDTFFVPENEDIIIKAENNKAIEIFNNDNIINLDNTDIKKNYLFKHKNIVF